MTPNSAASSCEGLRERRASTPTPSSHGSRPTAQQQNEDSAFATRTRPPPACPPRTRLPGGAHAACRVMRHCVKRRQSGFLARGSERRSAEAEAELLGLGALGVVPAVGRRGEEPAGQLSGRSGGAIFVSLLRPKRAAPRKAVSVGWVETHGPVFRGVRRRGAGGASSSQGEGRGLLPPRSLQPLTHREKRAHGWAPQRGKREPRPFPGLRFPTSRPASCPGLP